MSAVPMMRLVGEAINPPPRGVGWIDLATAAQRSGWSVGHLNRLCGVKWLALQLAKLETPPGGGKPQWYVREDADPKFGRVQWPEQLNFDARRLTAANQEEFWWRQTVLRRWEKAKEDGRRRGVSERTATADFLAHLECEGRSVTRSTLYVWHQEFRMRGPAGLVDKRWNVAPESGAPPADDGPFLEELKRLYLDANRPSKQSCFGWARTLGQKQGWSIPTYRTACRYLEAIPIKTRTLYRDGPEAYNNRTAPHQERDYTTIDSNEIWVGDHHQFDVMVSIGKGKHARPWLTAWLDMRSRLIVGYRIFIGDPNADRILQAFRSGCLAHGVPQGVYIDNGKDFDSAVLQGETKRQRFKRRGGGERLTLDTGVFGRLGVEVQHAQPYRPQSKTVERFFGTLCEQFSKSFITYCGGKPEDRPHDLDEKLRAGKAVTLAELERRFGDWLDTYHGAVHTGHGMDGRSPATVFRTCLQRKRTAPAELLDLLTLQLTPAIKVGRNGVRWKHVTYGRNTLGAYCGQEVRLRVDDRDVTRVQVFNLEGRFICVADTNERLPVKTDRQQLRDAIKQQKRDKQDNARVVMEVRPRLHLSIADRLTLEAAAAREREASDPQPPPPNIQPVHTDLAEQLPRIQRAMGKVAVGAESMSERPVSFRELDDAMEAARQRRRDEQDDEPLEDPFLALTRALDHSDDAAGNDAGEGLGRFIYKSVSGNADDNGGK